MRSLWEFVGKYGLTVPSFYVDAKFLHFEFALGSEPIAAHGHRDAHESPHHGFQILHEYPLLVGPILIISYTTKSDPFSVQRIKKQQKCHKSL
jgi:hypothetical protein